MLRSNDLFSVMDDFFNTGISNWNNGSPMLSQPKVNIKENDDAYIMEVAAPGLKKEDFNISVEKDHLVISSKTSDEKTEEKDQYTRREFNYSSFERRYYLPDTVDADKIVAKYEDGVLKLDIPKLDEHKPINKVIEIG